MRQSLTGVLVGTCLIFAFAVLITIAVFLALVAPSDRSTGFYLAMAIVCTAEFVFFAWTLNWTVSARTSQRLSGAALVTIHVMIAMWLLASIISGVIIAHPSSAQNHYADAAALVQAGLTLIFFALAYALYLKDLSLQVVDRQVQAERRELRFEVPGVEDVLRALQGLAAQFPALAADADRAAKKLDMVRTSLEFAPPAKIGTLEEEKVISTEEATVQIIDRIKALREQVMAAQSADADSARPLLEKISSLVDDVDIAVKHRQRLLTT